ncbi:hypothetical protein Rhal01_02397 [Rubritalea halochordaticola]|uniref:Dienelactone hydrolase domain-containing protein n=1 Tax=Rubritalea halochordaticola TaxID=714537 RepID=A0ABP9V0S1_9BACT
MKLFILTLTSATLALTAGLQAESLSQQAANDYIAQYSKELSTQLKKERANDLDEKKIVHADKTLKFEIRTYGEEPEGGHSLYISMHGGGGTTAAVNDQQWRNQIELYKPEEGFYVAPRAATNTWNLWHEAHIDPMFDRLIEDFIILKGVNPNKVYLTGYSAGGDGTYQLAPRMADRWAAAAMMAGHPNDAKPDNLYNLPFFIQCGGKDKAFDRNKIAQQWGEKLDELEKQHPGHYPHKWIVYPEHGHWMKLDCKQAIPWMAKYSRNPWPKTVVWTQDDITKNRLYWLSNDKPEKGQSITAKANGQTITLESDSVKEITLRLNDQLIDLDKEIVVKNAEGGILFQGKVERSKEAIETSLKERFDPTSAATALLKVKLNP